MNFAYEIAKGVWGLDAAESAPVVTDDTALSARFCLSTTDADRDGDIVEVRGLDFGPHRANPVVLFNHGRQMPFPVALSQTPDGTYTVEVMGEKAYGRAFFKSNIRESVQIYELVKSGLLRAASIGFIPKEMQPRTKGIRGMHHLSAEVTEWSVVPVGANRYALRDEIAKGVIAGSPIGPDLLGALAPYAAEKSIAWAPGFTPAPDPDPEPEGVSGEFRLADGRVMTLQAGRVVKMAAPDPDPDDDDDDDDDTDDDDNGSQPAPVPKARRVLTPEQAQRLQAVEGAAGALLQGQAAIAKRLKRMTGP